MLETIALAALLSAPPNVVMILADDQSYRDFGFMGNDVVHTPHLDRLASQSAVYPNGYAPMSVCRPSLATILTGLYPHQHGVHFNHPPPGLAKMRQLTAAEYRKTRQTAEHLVGARPTIPRLLAQAGYASLQAGKHWEGNFRNAGFTHGMTTGRPASTDNWILGTRAQNNGELVAHGNGDLGLAIGRQTMQPIDDFLDHVDRSQPFLIWYAPFLPHTPFNAGPEHHAPYQTKNLPPHLLPYYAEITRFDATVGELVEMIEARELMESTVFILASDNGFRPDVWKHDRADGHSKLSVDEDGLRTPILIAASGSVTPGRHDELVQTIDLLPTVLDATGRADLIPKSLPGISLWPSATGVDSLDQRPAFGAIYPNDATRLDVPGDHVRGRWIRDGQWKLVVPGSGPKPLEPALFDLSTDPDEGTNLIASRSHHELRRQLEARLDHWWNPATTTAKP